MATAPQSQPRPFLTPPKYLFDYSVVLRSHLGERAENAQAGEEAEEAQPIVLIIDEAHYRPRTIL